MNFKQLPLLLALGALTLGVSSCKSSNQDNPVNPNPVVPTPDPNADATPEALRGTWNLSDISVSPEFVTLDGQQVAVKDHIFDIFILGQMGTPTKLVVEKGKATFSGSKPDRTFAPNVEADGSLKYAVYPIGKLEADGDKLRVTIQVTNALMKRMPAFATGGGAGSANDGKQTPAPADRIFQIIAQGTQDLTITLVGQK